MALSVRYFLSSIRARYAAAPIIVAYDGDHIYQYQDGVGPRGERYIKLHGREGLSAGRNALVAAAATEYLMVMDDDF